MTERHHTTITIPRVLFDKLRKNIQGTGFSSVSDYVTYVMREIVASVEEETKGTTFSKEDEERVKKRLKALGYI